MNRSTIATLVSVVVAGAALVNMQANAPRGATTAPYTKLVYGSLQALSGNQTFSGYQVLPSDDPLNGRGITIASDDKAKPINDVTVRDCMIQANGDDGATVWDYCRRIRFENVLFLDVQCGNGAKAKQTKGCLIGASNNLPAPDYPTWVTFDHCTFQAFSRAPDVRGGVMRMTNCVCRPSARNVWTQAKANIDHTDFWTSTKPADATWWDEGRPIVLKDPLPNSIYVDVASCTLNGQPIKAAGDLFRKWQPDGSGSGNVDVNPLVFRLKPW